MTVKSTDKGNSKGVEAKLVRNQDTRAETSAETSRQQDVLDNAYAQLMKQLGKLSETTNRTLPTTVKEPSVRSSDGAKLAEAQNATVQPHREQPNTDAARARFREASDAAKALAKMEASKKLAPEVRQSTPSLGVPKETPLVRPRPAAPQAAQQAARAQFVSRQVKTTKVAQPPSKTTLLEERAKGTINSAKQGPAQLAKLSVGVMPSVGRKERGNIERDGKKGEGKKTESARHARGSHAPGATSTEDGQKSLQAGVSADGGGGSLLADTGVEIYNEMGHPQGSEGVMGKALQYAQRVVQRLTEIRRFDARLDSGFMALSERIVNQPDGDLTLKAADFLFNMYGGISA